MMYLFMFVLKLQLFQTLTISTLMKASMLFNDIIAIYSTDWEDDTPLNEDMDSLCVIPDATHSNDANI